jgi:hypothetical protein
VSGSSTAGQSDAGGGGQGSNSDHAQFLLDSAANVEDDAEYSPSTSRRAEVSHCFQVMRAESADVDLRNDLLLLDSCSTVNLIANPNLLRNIHTVPRRMHVHCNAGVRATNLMGTLGDFPEKVWHDPAARANILSLHSVKRHYRVRYDSANDDAITVTTPDGVNYRFVPHGKGLYAYQRNPETDRDWAFVVTVQEKKDLYTKRAYQAAVRARRVQNIIMHPGYREYVKIADQQLLQNCPVQRADIVAAEDIFGTNIGSLKGKTVTRQGDHVRGRIAGVPPDIKSRYQQVTLCVDIMNVNKLPFLVTTSRNIHFGTVEYLTNRQASTVSSALQCAIDIYSRRGFTVASIHADGAFQPLEARHPTIQFNFCAENEHIP